MPRQCGKSTDLPPLAGQDPAISPARRPWRADRFRRLPRLCHPAILRLAGRQIDRPRQDPRRVPDAAAPCAGRNGGRGIETTLPLFRALVREPAIIDGDYHIHWLEQYLDGKAGG